MRRPILNNSEAGQFVYDPFLGSGTTLIAAEATGRISTPSPEEPSLLDLIENDTESTAEPADNPTQP